MDNAGADPLPARCWISRRSRCRGPDGRVRKRMPAHRAFCFGGYAAYPDTRLVKSSTRCGGEAALLRSRPMGNTIAGPDGKLRCGWCAAAPEFLHYHDTEWGFPVSDDRRLFEKLSLEGFQSGLSWRTILAKRENFRAAFHDFDFERVARFGARDVERLLKDAGIVRHRGKIEALINNAKRARELVQRGGSLAAFVWRYEPAADERPNPQTASTSAMSIALSKELKKQGWQFVGPTTVYAFMQAMGLVNDHAQACVVRAEVERERERFVRPRG